MITHVQELFPDEPPSTANNATAQPGSRGSVSGSSGRGSEVGDGGSVSGGNGGVGSPVGSPGPRRSGQVSWADLTRAADRGRASWGGAVYNAGRAMCASLAWAFGRSASSAVLGGGGGGAGGTLNASQPGNNKSHASLPELVPPKPPRPLARLLKPTQAACDLLFSRAHDLSKVRCHHLHTHTHTNTLTEARTTLGFCSCLCGLKPGLSMCLRVCVCVCVRVGYSASGSCARLQCQHLRQAYPRGVTGLLSGLVSNVCDMSDWVK